MIAILSPAKTLDFKSSVPYNIATTPVFADDADYLVKKLSKMSKSSLKDLMHISDQLADLNNQRYKNWVYSGKDSPDKKQAIYTFNGDVYRGFDVKQLNKADIEYAQNHVRILSGLYGLLRPMDLIQAHRLEMGTRWEITTKNTNLYKYWGDRITQQLNEDIKGFTPKLLINLASNEYFKAINPKHFNGEVITISFKENRKGAYKVIAIYAKVARGAYARFMVNSRVQSIDDLKLFSEDGYGYDDNLSSENELVFTR